MCLKERYYLQFTGDVLLLTDAYCVDQEDVKGKKRNNGRY